MTHRTPAGFTLVEVVLVVVIIGLLATIAIPKLFSTRDRAFVAAMKSDLRNLVTAEESYFGDNVTYTNALGTTFSTSPGVTVTFSTVLVSGWAATAAHTGTTKTCSIYLGSGSGVAVSGQHEAEPVCQ
jgi:prepilin-type N-terminal cleavage/methylation domain-containing protein